MGFDLFQGFYFARPTVITGTRIDPARAALMNLLNLIRQDVDTDELCESIKVYPNIGVNVLRLVNSAAMTRSAKIGTVRDAVNYQAPIDQLTDRALVAKWPIARIDPTLRSLFRAAGVELTQSDTPPKVVITEYVDIARAFFPEGKEANFVNAVLDHMAHEAKPEAF